MLAPVRTWTPTPGVVRRTFLGALVMNTAIVVTGGAVRLTSSGLGCPTFPRCTDDSLLVTRELGAHGAIEFGNRLLTFVLTAAVVAAVVVAWRAGRRDLLRRALLLFGGIVAQAALGGVTVLTGLNPVTVMAHFLLSMVLLAVAVEAHDLAVGGWDAAAPVVRRELRLGALALTTAVATTLVLGTVVTGTGPHSGDKNASHRLPFDLETVSQLHADFVFLVVGLTVGLLVAARTGDAPTRLQRRIAVLLVVVLAQGAVGYTQYVTDLPVALVAVHVLGACLVWIATVRVLLAAARGRGGDDARSISTIRQPGSRPRSSASEALVRPEAAENRLRQPGDERLHRLGDLGGARPVLGAPGQAGEDEVGDGARHLSRQAPRWLVQLGPGRGSVRRHQVLGGPRREAGAGLEQRGAQAEDVRRAPRRLGARVGLLG